jgi:hypothetical protein
VRVGTTVWSNIDGAADVEGGHNCLFGELGACLTVHSVHLQTQKNRGPRVGTTIFIDGELRFGAIATSLLMLKVETTTGTTILSFH